MKEISRAKSLDSNEAFWNWWMHSWCCNFQPIGINMARDTYMCFQMRLPCSIDSSADEWVLGRFTHCSKEINGRMRQSDFYFGVKSNRLISLVKIIHRWEMCCCSRGFVGLCGSANLCLVQSWCWQFIQYQAFIIPLRSEQLCFVLK